jgi:hypothetical protein
MTFKRLVVSLWDVTVPISSALSIPTWESSQVTRKRVDLGQHERVMRN